MPKGILAAIQASEETTGKSPAVAKRISYATANKNGFMHGRNETPKGVRAERKFMRDHGPTGKVRMPRPKVEVEVHSYDWRQRSGLKRGE